ncbi:hypothetical protein DFA_04113 [Cavenderia fasciculata]|uniref:Glycosyltransferase 2-like domain-containing protein n=1 Tax=Cavenderia fasciculata TaxID=261658 RepID=F4Q1B7_CACFS|nr:uncharacterized protein DFA_04113 [Cavenderia fasciculata]EGG18618.1 hypothetical protein DFA_04113 [Cavenderia fasciculata]|eukprot:XP_004366522.1 hypothetical protein DFA_04113 [Cavenderia fasciculata]
MKKYIKKKNSMTLAVSIKKQCYYVIVRHPPTIHSIVTRQQIYHRIIDYYPWVSRGRYNIPIQHLIDQRFKKYHHDDDDHHQSSPSSSPTSTSNLVIKHSITNVNNQLDHDPLVSIIVPVYNHLEYLSTTIQSIANQTFKDYEVIIIDDGSTEWNSFQKINTIFNQFSNHLNLTILFQDNYGLSTSRNNGIQMSRGKWIFPLDGDDMIHPKTLESFIQKISSDSSNDHSLSTTMIISDLEGFIQTGINTFEPLLNWKIPLFSTSKLLTKNLFHCSAMFPKQWWTDMGGYSNALWFGWEDWDFWLRADHHLRGGINPLVIHKDYFKYRIKPGMHSFCKDNFKLCFAMFQTLHSNYYTLNEIIKAHRIIGSRYSIIQQPIINRLKVFPNEYILHLWNGLAYEYSSTDRKNITSIAKKSFQLSIKNNIKNDWQPIVLNVMCDRGTESFLESKRDLFDVFKQYPTLKDSLVQVYGNIF